MPASNDYDYVNDVAIREKIARTLEVEIDDHCEKSNERRKSRRVGSSQIGKPCSREIWYAFRWATTEELGSAKRPAGQVIRLFNRGHREEPEIIKYLEAVGCKFKKAEDADKQHAFTGCEDHAVTKLDGVGYLPEKFGVSEEVLFEFKTANDNSFRKMKRNGVLVEQPKYWAQVCFSGVLSGLKYVVFVIVSKNDDDLHLEFHKLDEDYGQVLVDKAMHIITAEVPPLRISESSTNFACKFCSYSDICFNGQTVERNCRSCIHSRPAPEGQWVCTNGAFDFGGEGYQAIPEDAILNGCDHHVGIHTL